MRKIHFPPNFSGRACFLWNCWNAKCRWSTSEEENSEFCSRANHFTVHVNEIHGSKGRTMIFWKTKKVFSSYSADNEKRVIASRTPNSYINSFVIYPDNDVCFAMFKKNEISGFPYTVVFVFIRKEPKKNKQRKYPLKKSFGFVSYHDSVYA